MKTIERNFTKNPHTARFLRTFHDANGANNGRPEETGLLNEIPVEAPVSDHRSPRQAELMTSLVAQITELNEELGRAAGEWTAKATEHGYWTAGREGTASAWISKMIAEVAELKAAAKVAAPAAPVTVEDGRYAIEEDGVLRFFKVKNGRRAGFVFLDIQASDDWHSIRNLTRIRKILALIAQDPKGAMIRYGVELGECGRCGRTLTSEYRKLGIGPVCIDK